MNSLRTSILSLALATGLACGLENPAPALGDAPAAKPQSEMEKWIETTDAQWQATYKRDVSDVRESELGKVKLQYLTSLAAAIAKASNGGDLDSALALRNEQKRFSESNIVPDHDEPSDVLAVKKLRAAARTQMARLEMDNAARAKAFHAKYDQALAQVQMQLTQRKRLDDALLVKYKRDEVARAWLPRGSESSEQARSKPEASGSAGQPHAPTIKDETKPLKPDAPGTTKAGNQDAPIRFSSLDVGESPSWSVVFVDITTRDGSLLPRLSFRVSYLCKSGGAYHVVANDELRMEKAVGKTWKILVPPKSFLDKNELSKTPVSAYVEANLDGQQVWSSVWRRRGPVEWWKWDAGTGRFKGDGQRAP